ncbi:M56 family metallopeptidase [Desulfoscipio sp. XC116]|uniref:M56 family metallopeptidase n=1 Tax=Desulfoscipio sp. XC116 TaxID=3144975 RepID=UPI00325A80E9
MQTFLTALLQCSVSMSLVTLAYMAIHPILSKRYTARWRYIVWLVIAAGWMFPFRPRIDLSFLPMQMPDMPVTPVQPITNAIPPMANAGDIVNAPATIPLWWVLAAIWILGVVIVVLYHTLRHGRFMKMVRRWSEPVTDLESLGILDSLKSQIGIKTQVGLNVCQSITSPMLVSLFHPAILLPPVKIAGAELSLILKHELIHFKRHDLCYKALILAATALHWFNPVVYLMAKATAVQCEISCDALVLQGADFHQRKQYGETIIGVVRNGAKLRTALSTNFYGGKKDMKNRIYSIMDTKQKRAGVAIFCIVLIGILTTGATLAAATDKEQANGPESKNVTNYVAIAEENIVETPESKAEAFAVYGQCGLTYNKNTDQLFYNEKLVRYFEDYYPVGDGASVGKSYFNENGTIDVHGVRNLSQLTLNPDGSTDPSGKLIGVEAYSQAEFEARDIEELKNPPMQPTAVESGPELTPDELAKLYSIYEPFGVTYDKKQDCFYYNGKLVRQFVDVLASNGESFSSGKFKGAMRRMGSPDGEIEIEAVRDYTQPDANGYGALIGIEVVE